MQAQWGVEAVGAAVQRTSGRSDMYWSASQNACRLTGML